MRSRAAPAALLSMMPLLSCTSLPVTPGATQDSHTSGRVSVRSTALGEHDRPVSRCRSGDRERFLGADFAADHALVIRLVIDPLDGPVVRIFAPDAPFERSQVFRRPDCRLFEFALDATGWEVNEISDYRVVLRLDCSRDGTQVAAQAESSHCH